MNKKRSIRNKWMGGASAALFVVLYSCASIGSPDGGMYDETPPVVVRTTPEINALNNKLKKISIEFDEYIKLENASEKVVISPAQLEQPEVKANGKKVEVRLMDSLKANTTYTIDFGDAIVDNNEGNPFGDYTFTFSTGDVIDSMQISGTVLDASNLEPVKGMLVGLHSNLEDSAFVKIPIERVGRTDSRGRFSIRGVAPGTYRIYGLSDINQNFVFDQKTEMIAFSDELIVPASAPDVRNDTVWRDSLTIDTIRQVHYTHFTPDNIVLRAFKETPTTQYMVKNERLVPTKFSFYFSAQADTLPTVEGLNFNAEDAFVLEHSVHNDTIHYWIKDSMVYNIDTLAMKVSYLFTDTLGQLVPRTDTLEMSPKTTRERLQKAADDKLAEWKKQLKKRLKRNPDDPDTIPPIEFLKAKVDAPSKFDIFKNVRIGFEEPLAFFNIDAIHLEQKVDTLWNAIPFEMEMDSLNQRDYTLYAEWRPEQEYKLTIDSLAFTGLYGKFYQGSQHAFKVRSLDEYSALFVHIPHADTCIVVQVIDSKEAVVRQTPVKDGRADFFFLEPGMYYMRLFYDRNGNGIWDTGLYEAKRQAEEVYYYPGKLELKAMWEVEQDWDLNAVPVLQQKPKELVKQKADKQKQTAKSRNEDRLKEKSK